MKKLITVSSIFLMAFGISCTKNGIQSENTPSKSSTQSATRNTTNGISTKMPAYYDAKLFNILFVEFSSTAEANLIAHNKSINFIFQSDNGLPNNQPFISVIDAIPGDGMNPVWREVQIVFNQGFTPRQLFSDDQVAAAASGPHPEITLDTTNEVYWCPVVGGK